MGKYVLIISRDSIDMMRTVVFAVCALLGVANLAFGDSRVCPDPSKAKNLLHQEQIHVRAPTFGRIEKIIVIPARKHISCILLNGASSAGPSGSVSIASIGLSEGNVAVKLISQVKQGIDIELLAYTE